MTNEEIKIRQLVSRFMDGETTIEEEDWLEEWFKNNPAVPEDLEPYRQAFLWLSRGLPVGEDGLPEIIHNPEGKSDNIAITHKAAYLKLLAAAIAVAVIALSAVVLFHNGADETERPQIAATRQTAPANVATSHDADSTANAEVRADTIAKPQSAKAKKPKRHRRYMPTPSLPMMDKPLIAISDSALQEADRIAGIELARMEVQQDEGLRQYEMALSETYDMFVNMYEDDEPADGDSFQNYGKSF